MTTQSILDCLRGVCGDIGASPATSSSQYSRILNQQYLINEKPPLTPPPTYNDKPSLPSVQQDANEQTALKIITILRNTANTNEALKAELEDTTEVTITGWSEWLAERIFHALRSTLGKRFDGQETKWAVALTDAYQAARATAEEDFSDLVRYVKEHPCEVAAEVALEVFLSLVAFGILVRMMRWVVKLLGFAELGSVAGSFAARWEARYAGFIPKGSLFSYLQRMGMTWT